MRFCARYQLQVMNVPWDERSPIIEQHFKSYEDLQTWILGNKNRADLHLGLIGVESPEAKAMNSMFKLVYTMNGYHAVIRGRECIKCAALIAEEFMNTRLEYAGCKAAI